MASKQLFCLCRKAVLPSHAHFDPLGKSFHGVTEVVDAVFAMYWPDGRPCVYAEMFLLEKGRRLKLRSNDGGSLKVVASDLSHLVRFCWEVGIEFWDLHDDNFYQFVQSLRAEKKCVGSAVKRRNDNTVARVIDTAIEFLIWLQTHVVHDRNIVGPRRIAPQISLLEKKLSNRRGEHSLSLKYPFTPTPDAADPKKPLTSHLRNLLWDGVKTLCYKAQKNLDVDQRNYLRARRELLLLLFEATGCRPGEAAMLSASDNENCVSKGKITLVTMKRRKGIDPKRCIPLDKETAIKLEVFIHKHRRELLQRLRGQKVEVRPQDKVFLGCRTGAPITGSSLIKEFQRVAAASGIDERACLSMFRHRFVTNMVKLHLIAFSQSHPGATRALISEGDYRTILRRVATFTGHGSEDSLFHYIDWAWEELEVFDYVSSARELTTSIERAMDKLRVLSSNVYSSASSEGAGEVIYYVLAELESIRKAAEDRKRQ